MEALRLALEGDVVPTDAVGPIGDAAGSISDATGSTDMTVCRPTASKNDRGVIFTGRKYLPPPLLYPEPKVVDRLERRQSKTMNVKMLVDT